MGMFDEFVFEDEYPLPEGLPRDCWQTKDLDCDLSHYLVIPDGRVLRRSTTVLNNVQAGSYAFSEALSGRLGLYTHEHMLTLVISNGFVTELIPGELPDTSSDRGWIAFPWPPND